MKRSIQLILTLSLLILFYSMPPIAKAESSPVWILWPSQPDVEIYKEWEITFSEAVDYRSIYSDNITVIRERDNQKIGVSPDILSKQNNVVKVRIHALFDFDETYYLYIKDVKSIHGDVLKYPVQMKFQTEKVDFNVNKLIEQDGLKFEATLGQTVDNLYAKVKVTNVSKEIIPYMGYDGLDKGLSTTILSKNDAGESKVGSKWFNTSIVGNAALWEKTLKPGEAIEFFEVLYLPSQPLYENNYLQVTFQKGRIKDPYPSQMLVEIPIELK